MTRAQIASLGDLSSNGRDGANGTSANKGLTTQDGLNGKTNHNYLSFRSSSHARKYGITGLTVGDNTFYSN